MQEYFVFFCETFFSLGIFSKKVKKTRKKVKKTIDKRLKMLYNNTENKAELSVLTFLPKSSRVNSAYLPLQ